MFKSRRLVIWTLVLGVLLVLPGTSLAAGPPIKIGLSTYLTGPNALVGKWINDNTKMAVDEINASGGILGRQIVLIPGDDMGETTTGYTLARRFIDRDKIDFLIGPDASAITLSVYPLTQKAGVIQLTTSVNPHITRKGNPWIFRLRPHQEASWAILIKYAVENMKIKDFGIIGVDTDYGIGGGNAGEKALGDYGIKSKIRLQSTAQDVDFSSHLLRMKQAGVKAILMTNVGRGLEAIATFVQQKHQLGLNAPIIEDMTANIEKTLTILGNDRKLRDGDVTGLIYTPLDKTPRVYEKTEKFRKVYSYDPDDHGMASYDAVYLLKAAAERAGTIDDKAKVRDALRGIKYQGVCGLFDFDQNGDGIWEGWLLDVKDGKMRIISDKKIVYRPTK
jgi:branched-chain amino acid transport system substrate-binding protein